MLTVYVDNATFHLSCPTLNKNELVIFFHTDYDFIKVTLLLQWHF